MSRVSLEDQIKTIAEVKAKIDESQNGSLIYLTISGSDLYGFASKDSDVDYRGTYLTGTENLLGLHRKRDIIEMKPDIVLFELEKELNLALKGNCNVLEHINADPIYRTSDFLDIDRWLTTPFQRREYTIPIVEWLCSTIRSSSWLGGKPIRSIFMFSED